VDPTTLELLGHKRGSRAFHSHALPHQTTPNGARAPPCTDDQAVDNLRFLDILNSCRRSNTIVRKVKQHRALRRLTIPIIGHFSLEGCFLSLVREVTMLVPNDDRTRRHTVMVERQFPVQGKDSIPFPATARKKNAVQR